jgi:hypothetical protein
MILTEEEDLIEMHKQHVDDVINAEKTEMQLISEVEKSGSDIEDYVRNFDQMLVKKLNMITAVRRKLADFNAHLQLEKKLQSIYHKKQQEMEDQEEFQFDESNDDYLQQDSEGMIMGVGMGNSNMTQNFAKLSSAHVKNGGNLLGGLHGDKGHIEDEGEENLQMDEDN